jgi:hypothetical protein
LCLSASSILAKNASAADAIYFSLQTPVPLPASPSSMLVQSPSFINVPAGAVLSVHLMRGDTLLSTSTLQFANAFSNSALVPPVPVASFIPLSDLPAPGNPLMGATLTPGNADLAALAAAPSQYRLLWVLSDGVIGTPGRAIVTGAGVGFINLKLTMVSAATRAGDQKPGSVLFYNRYTSNPTNTAREDTTLSLTNTNPAESANVRLFFISGASCQPAEFSVCLAPRQTFSILMSDIDPGTKGYGIAVACNASGQPIQFNWLIGHAQVKQPSPLNGLPYDTVLSALAIAKRTGGTVAAANGAAEMVFDDVIYDRLPGQIAADNVPSQTGGINATILALYRPLGNLAGGTISDTVQLSAYNDAGTNSSTTLALSCYREISVSALRLNPVSLSELIPPGVTAWFALSSTGDTPLLGAQLNAGRFSGGGTARALNFAAEYRISVPIKPVACAEPQAATSNIKP